MNKNKELQQNKLHQINGCFYQLILSLRAQGFNFCAEIVESAYRLYAAELEKRLS